MMITKNKQEFKLFTKIISTYVKGGSNNNNTVLIVVLIVKIKY